MIKISSNHMTQRKPKEYFSIYKCISLQNEYVSPCLLFFLNQKIWVFLSPEYFVTIFLSSESHAKWTEEMSP